MYFEPSSTARATAPSPTPFAPQRSHRHLRHRPTLDEVGSPGLEPTDFLRHHLERREGLPLTLVLGLPAPAVPVEDVLDLAESLGTGTPHFLWDAEPTAGAVVGLGAAHRLVASGAGRFASLHDQAEALWRRIERVDHPRGGGPSPRLWGGFAFDTDRERSALWRGFGDADFVLPRWLYRHPGNGGRDRGATLTLSVCCEALGTTDSVRAVVEELAHIHHKLGHLRRACSPRPEARRREAVGDPGSPPLHGSAPRLFTAQVEALRRAITEGHFEKVVAARCFDTGPTSGGRPSDALRQLRLRGLDGAGGAIRFAVGRGGATFLGATPERLVSRRGQWVTTEGLAGTRPIHHLDELLSSQKDDHEHRLVVETIGRRLRPWCDELWVAPRPGLRRAGQLVHLKTPIRGRLASPRHLLELAERLHPTPAVGGLPTSEAVEWIRRHESEDRGWYAGGVGWFDAAGDGELAVALRCGLLRQGRAHLFAGAGIVAGSDPREELRETELKARTLLDALVGAGRVA